ncbi:pilus assembly PilX family protein [Alteromonas facilis]|uniref:pilus assembly PilX family protein n=1 Tax=Alteromonas facilis TaxID=2048004 RepID=UPI000C28604E|nr:type II secretory pathway component [Alteromonas facilis]
MSRKSSLHKQRGSMLVVSLFVIIVLALLGLTMTRMLSATSESTIIEIYGVRALTAAQSGAQILLQQSFPLNAPPNTCNTTIDSPVSFGNIDGLKSCRYSATCTTESVTKAGQPHNYYRFSAFGECAIGNIVVNRQVALDAMQETP